MPAPRTMRPTDLELGTLIADVEHIKDDVSGIKASLSRVDAFISEQRAHILRREGAQQWRDDEDTRIRGIIRTHPDLVRRVDDIARAVEARPPVAWWQDAEGRRLGWGAMLTLVLISMALAGGLTYGDLPDIMGRYAGLPQQVSVPVPVPTHVRPADPALELP